MPTNTKALQVAEPAGIVAGKNAVINGGFDIWQRGTSVAGSATAFSADRWQSYRSVAGSTFSRQATGDTTNLPNIQYCARVQRDSGNTSTQTIDFVQSFESVNSIPFSGKTIAFSFYVRKGANFSGTITANVKSGTGTDQNGLSAFTGQSVFISQDITSTLTTTWQKLTFTGTVPSTATQLAIVFDWTPSGTAGAADYIEITGVQLELGNTATPFSRAGGTIQGELAACQRYYFRQGKTSGYNTFPAYGIISSSTRCDATAQFPVQMRVQPTSIDYAQVSVQDTSATGYLASNIVLDYGNEYTTSITITISGATAGRFGRVYANNSATANYLGFSAEL